MKQSYDTPIGRFVVSGSAIQITISFREELFTLTFVSIGLPPYVQWSVDLANYSRSGFGSIPFSGLSNGTYRFEVGPVAGYCALPSNGTVLVSGSPPAEDINFTPVHMVSTNQTSSSYGPFSNPIWGVMALAGAAGAIAVGFLLLKQTRRRNG
jgi:hypothetical protein